MTVSVLEYLKSTVLKTIDDDLGLALEQYDSEGRGGFLSIPREVFCIIDFLGCLLTGHNDNRKRSVEFMERYMASVDPRYGESASILYEMWRNGTVHEFDPKVFVAAQESFVLGWSANNSSKDVNRQWHLDCLAKEAVPDNYCLHINLFRLVEDLRKAVVAMIDDAKSKEALLRDLQREFENASKQFQLRGQDKIDQAKRIIESTKGVIDESKSIVREFSNRKDFDEFKKAWHNAT